MARHRQQRRAGFLHLYRAAAPLQRVPATVVATGCAAMLLASQWMPDRGHPRRCDGCQAVPPLLTGIIIVGLQSLAAFAFALLYTLQVRGCGWCW